MSAKFYQGSFTFLFYPPSLSYFFISFLHLLSPLYVTLKHRNVYMFIIQMALF